MPSIPKTSNMRYLILFFAIGASLQACTEEETDDLRNKWKLIEVLADPGDGSGTFQPVESDKTISFFEDETIISNGQLCSMGIASNNGSSGTYSETEMTITPENCGFMAYVINYEFEGGNLILNHPCIEACREKYELVD